MDLFTPVAIGTLISASVDGDDSVGSVTVGGLDTQVALLQSAGTSQSVNMQLTPTLGKTVFCYGMGDRPGSIDIQGKAFEYVCSGSGKGFAVVMEFYTSNRAVRNHMIDITIDGVTLRGFLLSLTVNKDDPAMKASSFSMQVATLPSLMGGG
jgi:hypothetical protein